MLTGGEIVDPSEVKVANGYSATDDLKYEMMRNLADNKNSPKFTRVFQKYDFYYTLSNTC